MDDLSGLEWTDSNPASTSQKPPPLTNSYPSLRPTPPLSGTSTPIAAPLSNKSLADFAPRSKISTPVNDSFANLISFNAAQPTKNLSLQEQQRLLQDQRAKAGIQKSTGYASAGPEGDFWDKLDEGKAASNRVTSPPSYTATNEYGGHKLSKTINKPFANINRTSPPSTTSNKDEDDLLAVFDASAPVDSSSHLPAPSRRTTEEDILRIYINDPGSSNGTNGSAVDDDPFGLGTGNAPKPAVKETAAAADDDDVLGLLARPASEFARKEPTPKPQDPQEEDMSGPKDHALAELVDMGFPPDKSREALRNTESGKDVQAAVGWLLNQAHEESRKKARPQKPQEGGDHGRDSMAQRPRKSRRRSGDANAEAPTPAWMQGQGGSTVAQRRQDRRSPANGEKDPAKMAAEIGSNLFKTANSIWKTGTKKLNQAVLELNSDSDSNQPKWMREASVESTDRRPSGNQLGKNVSGQNRPSTTAQQPSSTAEVPSVTDEALMLEQDARPMPRKPAGRPKQDVPAWSTDSSRDPSPAMGTRSNDQNPPQPRFTQKSRAPDPKTRLTRQAVEEQSSQAYISPVRRKKATPKPRSPESDLLFDASQATAKATTPNPRPKATPQSEPRIPPKTTISTRPPPPRRVIPSVSNSALQSSNTSRRSGTAAFKRGDYAEATNHYTSALSSLPPSHPLTIVLLTNRALAYLRTGDPKSCIADVIATTTLIGPSRGISETIDLGEEGPKDMHGFWSKALTRQAEALEQLERWPEAATVWKTCVEAGVGGATSIAGRNRCEKAAGGRFLKPSSTPNRPAALRKAPPKPASKFSALDDLSGHPTLLSSADSAEAVTRLRAANAEAERLDDEKFALSDQVTERVARWRGGKEGNLRALLASLESVLWEGAGWKKVGMGELILAGRVKVVYMKGISKVHPDKVCFPFHHSSTHLSMFFCSFPK